MSDMLQYALAWAARGFRVFPCIPLSKIPRDDEFYSVASSDPEVVRNLWLNPVTRQPGNYNIGVSTDDMVVVDVDVKDGRNGHAGFAELGGDPATLAVRTPTGGIHYYYVAESARNRVNIATGVDIRSWHGYVLAPGSHFVDAKKGVDGHYEIVNDTVPALVPDGIASCLVAPRETRAQRIEIEYDDDAAIEEAIDYLRHTARPSVEGMGGNNNGFEVAARVVNDLAISPELAAGLMAEHWNHRCEPPWDFADLHRFCENAATYATGTEGARRANVMFGEVTVLPQPVITPATAFDMGLYFGNLPSAHLVEKRPWMYSKFALRTEVTTIIAEGAGGKSTFAVVIAAHASLGLDFGPFKLETPGRKRVLVHDDENSAQEQARVLLAVCTQYQLDYEVVKQNVIFWTKDHPSLVLAHAEGSRVVINVETVAYLKSVMLDGGVDLFMLNPLVNLHQCNENDNTQMKAVMNVITDVATETNSAGLVFHHSAKGVSGAGKKSAGNSEISRGAGAIINASRIALTITWANEDDKDAIGIREDGGFSRIDDAKSNVHAKSNAEHAKMWLRWSGVKLHNGEVMGVPSPYDITRAVDMFDGYIVQALDDILTKGKHAGRIALTDAIKNLLLDDLIGKQSQQALRSRLDRMAIRGAHYTLAGGRSARLQKEIIEGQGAYLSLA